MYYKNLPEVTKKQEEIINFIFKFRFANRIQVQKELNHKDARRINAWLKDLVDKKYLGRIYSHKLLENTKPAIYYLENNGIIYVKREKGFQYKSPNDELETKQVKKFYDDKKASKTFIEHCICVCNVYLEIKKIEKNRKNISYDFLTKTEIWIQKQMEENFWERKVYIPDLYIEAVQQTKIKIQIDPFFLEVFDPQVPRYAIRYKIKKYIQFIEEEIWKNDSLIEDDTPYFLLVISDQRKLRSIKKFIEKELAYSPRENIFFALTTIDKAITISTVKNPWEEINND